MGLALGDKMNKAALYQLLIQTLEERGHEVSRAWSELQESNQQEGKSSAGDKHETGAAMVHLEMEKLGRMMEDHRKQRAEAERCHPKLMEPDQQIRMGSLVQTSMGWFYLVTSLGKLKIEGQDCFVLSGASPLGHLLLGKTQGDTFSRDGKEIKILQVL
jgi:transcription elongation GreA/GreB family factor